LLAPKIVNNAGRQDNQNIDLKLFTELIYGYLSSMFSYLLSLFLLIESNKHKSLAWPHWFACLSFIVCTSISKWTGNNKTRAERDAPKQIRLVGLWAKSACCHFIACFTFLLVFGPHPGAKNRLGKQEVCVCVCAESCYALRPN